MKLPAYFVSNHSPRPLLAAATVFMTAVLLTGCSSPADTKPDSAPGASTSASAVPSELQQVDGRAVSATDTELVLRTAEGDRTFQINEEDLQAIDPAHYNSHAGIPSIGFRVYYRTEGGVEKVVSVEEIAGSTLGFD